MFEDVDETFREIGDFMESHFRLHFDYIALEDLKKELERLLEYDIESGVLKNVEPISLISLEGFSEFSPLDVLKRVGDVDQLNAKVEEAAKEVYSQEFHRGNMKKNPRRYAGAHAL